MPGSGRANLAFRRIGRRVLAEAGGRLPGRWGRLALQVYAGGVVVMAMLRGNDWEVLFWGLLLLPVVAEYVMRPAAVDTRPRPAEWRQVDETALRAKESWALWLRRAFWVAFAAGLVVGDRVSAGIADDGGKVTARSVAMIAALGALFALVFLTRGAMGAFAVRRAEAAVAAEGRYPLG